MVSSSPWSSSYCCNHLESEESGMQGLSSLCLLQLSPPPPWNSDFQINKINIFEREKAVEGKHALAFPFGFSSRLNEQEFITCSEQQQHHHRVSPRISQSLVFLLRMHSNLGSLGAHTLPTPWKSGKAGTLSPPTHLGKSRQLASLW